MRVKYKQRFLNECGKASVNNLLSFYKLSKKEVDVNVSKEGCSINDLCKVLKKYFYTVEAISFDISQLKDIKEFSPFIALMANNGVGHYVFIYKKNKKYLYVIDSLTRHSYKISYEKAKTIFSNKAIVVEKIKQSEVVKVDVLSIVIVTFLSMVEAILSISLSYLIKQTIDEGYKNGILFICIEFILLFITFIKLRMFLKSFRKSNESIVIRTVENTFNLKEKYIASHEVDEIIYRSIDANKIKEKKLFFTYGFIGDVCLLFSCMIMLFFYSYQVAILLIILSIPIILFSAFFYRKEKISIEKRRESEYRFINSYKEDFINKRKDDSLKKIEEFLNDDYRYIVIVNMKNYLLLVFQTFIFVLLVVLYFSRFNSFLSFGSLIALMNLASLMLSPLLSILRSISDYSNYKEMVDRIINLQSNLR